MTVNLKLVRSRLEQDRKRLLGELEQLAAAGRPTDERRQGSPFGKREEEATETLELEKRLVLEHGTKKLLADIDHALRKIEAGTYGRCDVCGRPIDPNRLEALPQANLCLKCKAKVPDARAKPV